MDTISNGCKECFLWWESTGGCLHEIATWTVLFLFSYGVQIKVFLLWLETTPKCLGLKNSAKLYCMLGSNKVNMICHFFYATHLMASTYYLFMLVTSSVRGMILITSYNCSNLFMLIFTWRIWDLSLSSSAQHSGWIIYQLAQIYSGFHWSSSLTKHDSCAFTLEA